MVLMLIETSDLDYEFPSTDEEGQGFADLLTALRSALDLLQYSNDDDTPYILSAAISAATNNSGFYKVPQMNSALDFWNLMVCLRLVLLAGRLIA